MFVLIGLDIPIKLNSSFYNEGELVTKRKMILINYLRNELFSDLLLFVCLELISLGTIISLFSLLSLKKYVHMHRIWCKLDDIFQLNIRFPVLIEMLELLYLITMVAHYCGNGFHLIGQ
jgi:hypothetical protein